MPIDYKKYPENWKTYIRHMVLRRAGNMCEGSPAYPQCRARNYEPHPVTGSRVVLTIAHMDHDIKNNDGMDRGGMLLPKPVSNFRAWCQRCHLTHDTSYKNTKRNRRRGI